jgi:hypothetical protein
MNLQLPTPGTKFVLWYAGRTVGQGEVLRVVDEIADSIRG